jgi:tetratricopeptide (TPR) repeat protein
MLVATLTVAVQRGPEAAAAEPPPASSNDVESTAYALFQEGRALLKAGDCDAAAAKLEESFRLDPGGGTKLNLALAYELAGKTASAWTAFGDALRMAKIDGRADRAAEAHAHLDRLEQRLSLLQIVVPEAARIAGMTVRRDGIDIGEASWNVETPIDPGEHVIEATAPGKRTWRATVTIGDDADRKELTVNMQDEGARLALPPNPTSARGDPGRRAAGYAAFAGAGLFAGAAVVAWRVHENNLAIYNDDTRCLQGTETRGEQCGGQGRTAGIALDVEVSAFAAAAIVAALGGWLLWVHDPRSPPTRRASCAPSNGLGLVCGGHF